MASSSDGPPDDPKTLSHEDDDHMSETSTATSITANTKDKQTVCVKFEFKVTSDTKSFSAPSIHRNILSLLERSFPSTTVSTIDNSSGELIISNMTDENFNSTFEYETFERSKHKLVCVAHNICSSASYLDMKSAINTPLRQNNCFIRINKWGSELDIVNIGWLYKSNPKTHNRDQIKSIIAEASRRLDIPFSNFEMFTKALSFVNKDNKKTRTYAIQFACPKHSADNVKTMLKKCFEDENTYLPGKFIPNDIANTNENNSYEKYLKLQNKYLSSHRSIRINGIHPSTMTTTFKIRRETNLMKLIKNCSFVDWISNTNQTETSGKYAISTNETSYHKALNWVENTFLNFHDELPTKIFPPEFEGTKAIMLSRLPRLDNNSKQDSYTASLIAEVSDLSDTSYSIPPTNAWSKPLSIVATSVQQANEKVIESNPSSSITTTNDSAISQISALTDLVEQLRKDMKEQLRIQQESIETIVEQTISSKLSALDKHYEQVIEKINKKWESTMTEQLEKAEKGFSDTVDKVIERRDELHKQSRSDPGSGNSRARKLPRPPPPRLSSVKTGLITKFLAPDTSMDNVGNDD